MAELKFSCPHCQQHIQAEAGYAGMQIACPSCKGSMTVPGAPAVPPPPPSAPPPSPRLSVSAPPPPSSAPPLAGACPSCGGALQRGAVLCTACGYNAATGQRTVAGRPAPLGKPGKPSYEAPWYRTPYPYVGAMVLVLGLLYYLGRQNPVIMAALVAVGALYCLVVHIMVAVAAFRESGTVGMLTLCVPFYAFYYVFKVSDNDTLKVLYAFAALINIGLRFLPE